ncbi:autophagy-related protein 13 [Chytridium lagenaria]|nr:autophagy-related protein 13 [Chytridium lagenaria]
MAIHSPPHIPSPPLIIDIFLDLSEMTPTQHLILKDETTLRRHRIQHPQKPRILLETWQLSLSFFTPGLNSPEVAVIYKKAVVFFRSLYSFARLLPSYRLFKRVRRGQCCPLKIGYRLSTARFMPLDEVGLDQVHLNADPRKWVSEYNFGGWS